MLKSITLLIIGILALCVPALGQDHNADIERMIQQIESDRRVIQLQNLLNIEPLQTIPLRNPDDPSSVENLTKAFIQQQMTEIIRAQQLRQDLYFNMFRAGDAFLYRPYVHGVTYEQP